MIHGAVVVNALLAAHIRPQTVDVLLVSRVSALEVVLRLFLVPFKDDVQAFFSGGIYDADAMTVVAVWRGETDSSVEPYGGSRRLLEGFLSTMQVWPASTTRSERR